MSADLVTRRSAARRTIPVVHAWLLVAALLGIVAAESRAAEIHGTATYRERMALPPDAIFEAILEDVSRADAPATPIGRTRLESPGLPPIRFTIPYEPRRIDPRHRYAVRATIRSGRGLIFTTDHGYPVLTGGQPARVDVRLARAGSGDRGPDRERPRPPADRSRLSDLPATFSGVLPCADCAGIRYDLNLFPPDAFFIRTTYLRDGQDVSTYDVGQWSVAGDERTLTLRGDGAPMMWEILGLDRLRKLDQEGWPIRSSLPYEIVRQPHLQSLEPRLRMRGSYRYMADAGLFTECATGLRWPVAQVERNADLERAYGKARHRPGEPVLVEVAGRVALGPRMEGEGLEPTLVVERLIGVWPNETCGPRGSTSDIEGTRWVLVRLGNDPVAFRSGQKEAFIVLEASERRVTGSGGCNRLAGSFIREGQQLRFAQVVATRMACVVGMDIETRLLAALDRTRRWRVADHHLELSGADGRLLARFEARDL